MSATSRNGAPPLSETESSVTLTSSQPVIYRYVYTDIDGEIIQTLEDTKPIEFTSFETTLPLTDKTVLEVVTTKKSYTRRAVERATRPTVAPTKENAKTSIKIHSPYIINVLREVLNKQWVVNLDLDTVKIDEPYRALVYHLEEMRLYKNNHPPGHSESYVKTCNYHIDILLGFLENELGTELRLERQRREKSPPKVTYNYLWLLFKPGDDVFINETSEAPLMPMTVFRTLNAFKYRGNDQYQRRFDVHGWRIQSSNKYACTPIGYNVYIEEFEGEKDICMLPVIPKEFMPEYKTLERRFIDRGKKWFSVRNLAYKEYSGMTLQEPKVNVYLISRWVLPMHDNNSFF
jgi:uncharacterized protein DUF7025